MNMDDNVKLALPNATFANGSVLSVAQVDALPCALPHGVLPSHHEVVERIKADLEKDWKKHYLGTAVRPPPLSIEKAGREYLANWIDQLGRSNGSDRRPSFKDICFVHGTRMNGKHKEETIIAHNKDSKLGEVVFCSSLHRLSLINYGAYILNIGQVIVTGRSNKVGVEQQSGQHGEGFKRATATYLEAGFNVMAKVAVLRNGDMVFATWRFHESKNDGVVECDERFPSCVKEQQRLKGGPLDTHRFELVIEGLKPFVFDLFSYIVPDISHMRDKAGSSDHGSVLLKPDHRGTLYVWYFKVCKVNPNEMRFGYNLFLPKIERDRNHIDRNSLIVPIANIWNNAILSSKEMAETFYDTVLLKEKGQGDQRKRNYVERDAVYMFTIKAKQVLADIFKARNPNAVPVSSDMLKSRPVTRIRPLIKVPERCADVFDVDDSLNLTMLIEANTKMLLEGPPTQMPTSISDHFKRYCGVRYAGFVSTCILPYAYDAKTNVIVLNSSHFDKMTQDQVIAQLGCVIIPRVFEDNDKAFDPSIFFMQLKDSFAAPFAPVAKPPPPPPPQSAPLPKLKSVGPTTRTSPPPPPSKRDREFLVPEGYEALDTADLMIFKKKK